MHECIDYIEIHNCLNQEIGYWYAEVEGFECSGNETSTGRRMNWLMFCCFVLWKSIIHYCSLVFMVPWRILLKWVFLASLLSLFKKSDWLGNANKKLGEKLSQRWIRKISVLKPSSWVFSHRKGNTNAGRQGVQEFTRKGHAWVWIQVNFCIGEVDRIGESKTWVMARGGTAN